MRDVIKNVKPLGFAWEASDPFLFCVHHVDHYPAGNDQMAPTVSLAGRNLGSDFEVKDGFRMYHGTVVPGFPGHPHRGFETVTLARRGFIDHADSLGAAARFGRGDVQWVTAGQGIVHSEMFPLIDRQGPNDVELFQIWLNLPRADKMAPPEFSMLWDHTIPRHRIPDGQGRGTLVTVVAGQIDGVQAPRPPSRSWAARPDTDVAIWLLQLEPGARFTLPAAARGSNRTLYFFHGGGLSIAGQAVAPLHAVELHPEADVPLVNGGDGEAELLLLQGRPISEPVTQYGPFVMSSPDEIRQAMIDYQRTRFGGWPWPSDDPVHPRDQGRFARHPDGRIEHPSG
jgi:redox-sensitive bicupin YhaK (pirin superfamily)